MNKNLDTDKYLDKAKTWTQKKITETPDTE